MEDLIYAVSELSLAIFLLAKDHFFIPSQGTAKKMCLLTSFFMHILVDTWHQLLEDGYQKGKFTAKYLKLPLIVPSICNISRTFRPIVLKNPYYPELRIFKGKI